jgi:hypothetical protein
MKQSIDNLTKNESIDKKIISKSKLLNIVGVSVPFISGFLNGVNDMDKNTVTAAALIPISGGLYSIGKDLQKDNNSKKFGYFTEATGVAIGSASLGYVVGYLVNKIM